MTHAAPLSARVPKEWHRHGVTACVLNALTAVIYLWMQRNEGTRAFVDAPLVSLMVLNCVVVYGFGLLIVRDLAELLRDFSDKAVPPDTSIDTRVASILTHKYAHFAAFGGALFAGCGAFMISPWDVGSPLRSVFAFFVFTGNLIVGYAIWGIVQFWRLVLRNVETQEFLVLNLSRAPLPALMRVNSRVVMVTAFVASAALLGLGLSDYEAETPIKLFSLFAFLMVAATYAVPVVPISNRLRRLKTQALNEVEARIHQHVSALTDPNVTTDDLPALSDLKEARDMINKIQTLPPGGQVSVSAAAFATSLPFIPTAVEYLTGLFP